MNKETVLLTLCGLSPAVVSETVWALCNESPPVRISRVVVFTTERGKSALYRDLLDNGTWEKLVESLPPECRSIRFGKSGDSIRIFPSADSCRDLDDVRTVEDNAATADFILENVRQFTETPNTQTIFSIAGGRKTMSVLSGLCMSLLGHKEDRLCHVLVPPPFDDPNLVPKFFFPDTETKEYELNGERISANAVTITLTDVPFVPLRYLFEDITKELPSGYMHVVQRVRDEILKIDDVSLKLHLGSRTVVVDEKEIRLSAMEFLICLTLAQRRVDGTSHVNGVKKLYEVLTETIAKDTTNAELSALLQECNESLPHDLAQEDIRKRVSSIKTKMKKVLSRSTLKRVSPLRGDGFYGFDVKRESISLIDL